MYYLLYLYDDDLHLLFTSVGHLILQTRRQWGGVADQVMSTLVAGENNWSHAAHLVVVFLSLQ